MCQCENCIIDAAELAAWADELVANGIDWLNTYAPENRRELVDLDRLDINSSTCCILGQIYQDRAYNAAYTRDSFGRKREFSSGYEYAVYTFFDGRFSDLVTGPYGFSGYGEDVPAGYITEAWVRALSA